MLLKNFKRRPVPLEMGFKKKKTIRAKAHIISLNEQ